MIIPFWTEENAAVTLVTEFIDKYHPGKTPEDMGASYYGAFFSTREVFDILEQAVKDVGAANVNGQALLAAAAKYSLHLDGLPEYSFTGTARYAVQGCAIYRWSAAAKGLVKLSDWLPWIQ